MKLFSFGIFFAIFCSLATNNAHASSVWSASLFDDKGGDWVLHLITAANDLSDGSQITNVYLDSSFDGFVDPNGFLTEDGFLIPFCGYPIDPCIPDLFDWYSTAPPNIASFHFITEDLYEMEQLIVDGAQAFTGASELSCVSVRCRLFDQILVNNTGLVVSFLSPTGTIGSNITFMRTAVVPVPATVWLFGTALIGFVGYSRRRKIS